MSQPDAPMAWVALTPSGAHATYHPTRDQAERCWPGAKVAPLYSESAYLALLARVEAAEGALKNLVCAVSNLMAESRGVDGLHRNGDLATWEDIGPDGRYSEWLGDSFHEARSALRASGTREGE